MKERLHSAKSKIFDRLAKPTAQYLVNDRLMSFYRSLYAGGIEQPTLDFLQEKHEQGYTTLAYGPHTSHFDGVALSFVTEPICQQLGLSGFLIPGAVSMAKQQGKAMQEFSGKTIELLMDHGLEIIPVARPKDREKYGIVYDNREQISRIVHARGNNQGIAMLPEGTVQGGRINPETHRPYGMQKPDEQTAGLISLLARYNKVVFLPVGIVGSHNIFSADGLFITPEFLRELLKHESKLNHIRPLAQLNVGTPFTTDDLIQTGIDTRNPHELTHHVMTRLLELTPPETHGVYARQ